MHLKLLYGWLLTCIPLKLNKLKKQFLFSLKNNISLTKNKKHFSIFKLIPMSIKNDYDKYKCII